MFELWDRGKMPSKRVRPKVRGKKDVVDEWEITDIDRNEQKMGLKRRAKRWREIETEKMLEKVAEKVAIKNAEKMNPDLRRPPNLIEEAWLRCDYCLSHFMQPPAYNFMENVRMNDPECYKALYKIFMSPNMMEHIGDWVNFFAAGQKVAGRIPLSEVYKHYRKIKGIKGKVVVKRKGKKDKEL